MKLALLDKDGTLVTSTNPSGFVSSPEDQILRQGSLNLVKKLLDLGYNLVVVSNQGGVASGHKTLRTAIDEMLYCNQLFVKSLKRSVFEMFYFCPDFKGESCWYCEPQKWTNFHKINEWRFSPQDLKGGWLENEEKTAGKYRKPNCGMLKIAIRTARLTALHIMDESPLDNKEPELEDVLMIGDRSEDFGAAMGAKVRFLYVDEALEQFLNNR
ncbi:MAG: HAD hydrolase-like protein [Sphaerospermopsis kisseleviana]